MGGCPRHIQASCPGFLPHFAVSPPVLTGFAYSSRMRRSPIGDGLGPLFGGDSPGGGIGRRAWLRAMCPLGRAGSTPVPGSFSIQWFIPRRPSPSLCLPDSRTAWENGIRDLHQRLRSAPQPTTLDPTHSDYSFAAGDDVRRRDDWLCAAIGRAVLGGCP